MGVSVILDLLFIKRRNSINPGGPTVLMEIDSDVGWNLLRLSSWQPPVASPTSRAVLLFQGDCERYPHADDRPKDIPYAGGTLSTDVEHANHEAGQIIWRLQCCTRQ